MKCPACKSALREKGADGVSRREGEFSRSHQEVKGAKTTSPGWAAAIAYAATHSAE